MLFKIKNTSKLSKLLSDLAKVDSSVKLCMASDKTYVYVATSLLSKDINKRENIGPTVIKSFSFVTSSLFDGADKALGDQTMELILIDAAKVAKKLALMEETATIECKTRTSPTNKKILVCSFVTFSDGTINVSEKGGETRMVTAIDTAGFEKFADPAGYRWEFTLSKDLIGTAKKMASIETEESITLYEQDGDLKIGELAKWGLKISEATSQMKQLPLNFAKKHLANINCFGEHVIWRMRDGFFYVQDGPCAYMFSYETDFDEYEDVDI